MNNLQIKERNEPNKPLDKVHITSSLECQPKRKIIPSISNNLINPPSNLKPINETTSTHRNKRNNMTNINQINPCMNLRPVSETKSTYSNNSNDVNNPINPPMNLRPVNEIKSKYDKSHLKKPMELNITTSNLLNNTFDDINITNTNSTSKESPTNTISMNLEEYDENNQRVVLSMSSIEIESEINQLQSKLNPNTLAFLQKRGHDRINNNLTLTSQVKQQVGLEEDVYDMNGRKLVESIRLQQKMLLDLPLKKLSIECKLQVIHRIINFMLQYHLFMELDNTDDDKGRTMTQLMEMIRSNVELQRVVALDSLVKIFQNLYFLLNHLTSLLILDDLIEDKTEVNTLLRYVASVLYIRDFPSMLPACVILNLQLSSSITTSKRYLLSTLQCLQAYLLNTGKEKEYLDMQRQFSYISLPRLCSPHVMITKRYEQYLHDCSIQYEQVILPTTSSEGLDFQSNEFVLKCRHDVMMAFIEYTPLGSYLHTHLVNCWSIFLKNSEDLIIEDILKIILNILTSSCKCLSFDILSNHNTKFHDIVIFLAKEYQVVICSKEELLNSWVECILQFNRVIKDSLQKPLESISKVDITMLSLNVLEIHIQVLLMFHVPIDVLAILESKSLSPLLSLKLLTYGISLQWNDMNTMDTLLKQIVQLSHTSLQQQLIHVLSQYVCLLCDILFFDNIDSQPSQSSYVPLFLPSIESIQLNRFPSVLSYLHDICNDVKQLTLNIKEQTYWDAAFWRFAFIITKCNIKNEMIDMNRPLKLQSISYQGLEAWILNKHQQQIILLYLTTQFDFEVICEMIEINWKLVNQFSVSQHFIQQIQHILKCPSMKCPSMKHEKMSSLNIFESKCPSMKHEKMSSLNIFESLMDDIEHVEDVLMIVSNESIDIGRMRYEAMTHLHSSHELIDYMNIFTMSIQSSFVIYELFYLLSVCTDEYAYLWRLPLSDVTMEYNVNTSCLEKAKQVLFHLYQTCDNTITTNPLLMNTIFTNKELVSLASKLIETFIFDSFDSSLHVLCISILISRIFPWQIREKIWREIGDLQLLGLLNENPVMIINTIDIKDQLLPSQGSLLVRTILQSLVHIRTINERSSLIYVYGFIHIKQYFHRYRDCHILSGLAVKVIKEVIQDTKANSMWFLFDFLFIAFISTDLYSIQEFLALNTNQETFEESYMALLDDWKIQDDKKEGLSFSHFLSK